MTVLAGLFAAAFLAATLVPFQSEIVFVAVQLAGGHPLWLLVAVAGLGNTLGAFVTYGMARGALRLPLPDRWRPDPARRARAEAWWTRWGVWSLLMSWAPLGDVLLLVAGALRSPFWQVAALVGFAKTARYAVLGWATATAAAAV